MKKLALVAMACAAITAAVAPGAFAGTVTFDDVAPITVVGDNETVSSGGFSFRQLGSFGAVADELAFTAFGNAPTGNATQFYGAFNDSSVRMRHGGLAFKISSLDTGFVSVVSGSGDPGVSPGGLVLDGMGVDGNSYSAFIAFGAADGNGDFPFSTANMAALGAIGSQFLWSLTMTACTDDGNGNCVSPNLNLNQFAIDNLVLAVPEPGSLGLAALALCGAVAARRRRV